MGVEIERRFLVFGQGWKGEETESIPLRDGLVAVGWGRKVRVRIAGDRATLTVKGPRRGLRRSEFEYEIPLADAECMLAELCRRPGQVTEKTRHIIPAGDLKWEVDVYHGLLSGVTTAEIELPSAATAFARPDWLGPEVSGDLRFTVRQMVRDRLLRSWAAGLLPVVRRLGRRMRHRLRPARTGRGFPDPRR